jgi:hypothetical protein
MSTLFLGNFREAVSMIIGSVNVSIAKGIVCGDVYPDEMRRNENGSKSNYFKRLHDIMMQKKMSRDNKNLLKFTSTRQHSKKLK